MAQQIKFGTDGWRGIIADDYTFENVRRVSNAIANYVHKHEDAGKGPEFAREIYTSATLPGLQLPEDLRMEVLDAPLTLRLKITAPKRSSYETRLTGELTRERDQ